MSLSPVSCLSRSPARPNPPPLVTRVTCHLAVWAICPPESLSPAHPGALTYSDDGVQLRSRDLLGSLDGSQDLLLMLEQAGGGGSDCSLTQRDNQLRKRLT